MATILPAPAVDLSSTATPAAKSGRSEDRHARLPTFIEAMTDQRTPIRPPPAPKRPAQSESSDPSETVVRSDIQARRKVIPDDESIPSNGIPAQITVSEPPLDLAGRDALSSPPPLSTAMSRSTSDVTLSLEQHGSDEIKTATVPTNGGSQQSLETLTQSLMTGAPAEVSDAAADFLTIPDSGTSRKVLEIPSVGVDNSADPQKLLLHNVSAEPSIESFFATFQTSDVPTPQSSLSLVKKTELPPDSDLALHGEEGLAGWSADHLQNGPATVSVARPDMQQSPLASKATVTSPIEGTSSDTETLHATWTPPPAADDLVHSLTEVTKPRASEGQRLALLDAGPATPAAAVEVPTAIDRPPMFAPLAPSGPASATLHTSQPPANPLDRSLANQVTQQLANQLAHQPGGGAWRRNANGDRSLMIRLTPPELGTVRVELRERDGLISVRLHAEDPAVRQALERALPQVRNDLRTTDSPLQHITVDSSATDERAFDGRGGGAGSQNSPQNNPNHHSRMNAGRNSRDGDRPIFSLAGSAAAEPQIAPLSRPLGGRVTAVGVVALA